MPYILFGLMYVFFLLEVIYLKIFKKTKVIYYPDETIWLSVNFMIVLPKRLAFEFFYFAKMHSFSGNFLFNIALCIGIIFIVGLPIIMIVIMSLFIKNRDMLVVGRKISKRRNLKLIFLNGKVTRNMKKTYDKVMTTKEFLQNVSKKNGSGMVKTKKGSHFASFDEETRAGAKFTSKEQSQTENLILKNETNSYAYAQIFGENKNNIDKKDMMNPQLIKEAENSLIYVAKSNLLLSKTNERYIIFNHNNKQSFIEISEKQKKMSKEFIERCGGEEKANEAIKFNLEYKSIIDEAGKMLFELANADIRDKHSIFLKYENVHKQLNILSKDDEYASKILEKIENFIN